MARITALLGLTALLAASFLGWLEGVTYSLSGSGASAYSATVPARITLWELSAALDVLLAVVVALGVVGLLVPLRDHGPVGAVLGAALAPLAWLFSPLEFLLAGEPLHAGTGVALAGMVLVVVAVAALARGAAPAPRAPAAFAYVALAVATPTVMLARVVSHRSLWQTFRAADLVLLAAAATLVVAAAGRLRWSRLAPALAAFIAVAALGDGLEPILAERAGTRIGDGTVGAGAWLLLLLVAPIGLIAAGLGVRDSHRRP